MRFSAKLIALFLVIACCVSAQSGLTNVTATVQDASGNKYVNGPWNASLIDISDPSTCFGPGQPTPPIAVGTIDSFGILTTQLTDNLAIACTGTHWRFNIQSKDRTVAFSCTVTITGASQDITSLLTACAAPLIPAISAPYINSPMSGNSSPVRIDGFWFVGSGTGSITSPASAPTVAVDATSGGSFDNTTRHFRITLVHYFNGVAGETPASPAATITPSTCGGGACTISVNVAGNEWRLGAEGYRVYQCSDASSTSSCHLRTGFNGALTILPNAHYTPGTVILTASDLTNVTAPPSSNTTTIDADQVAYNASCNNFASSNLCYGTVQYNQNPVGGYAQTGLGPLLITGANSRIRGHAAASVDTITPGSTRSCSFTSVELGCVMVQNVNGVSIRGLHINAVGQNGYMLNTWAGSFNQIEIGDATVVTTGSNAIAPLRIKGIWYYLSFPNLQLTANTTGTGSNRGAGVLVSNASGANWKFSGPVRWTIRDNNDAIRSDVGFTDIDHGNSTSFPTMVGEFKAEDVQIQWGPTGSGQGVLISGVGLVPQFNRVSHSDYGPSAGAPAFIQIGADTNGAAACCTSAFFSNSPALSAHTNNAAFIKVNSNSGNAFRQLKLLNMNMARPIDLNSLALSGGLDIESTSNNSTSNYCNPASNLIVNALSTQSISCKYPVNNGITNNRVANYRFTGGLGFFSDADGTKARHFYWEASNSFGVYEGDPTNTANRIWLSFANGSAFYDTSGNRILDIPRTAKSIGVGRQADANSAITLENNRRIAFTNAAGSAFVSGINLDASDNLKLYNLVTITSVGDASVPGDITMNGRTFTQSNAGAPELNITDTTTPVTFRVTINSDTNARAGTKTNHPLNLTTNDTNRWQIDTSGNLLASTDNTEDIGGVGGTGRPRSGFFGTKIVAPAVVGDVFSTSSNCSSNASPAVCGAAAAGSVVVAAGATTIVVNTTAVTASSQVILTRDNSLGTKLSVTCNTQSSLTLGTPYVSARTASTSFTVTIDVAPTTNPMCISYVIVN